MRSAPGFCSAAVAAVLFFFAISCGISDSGSRTKDVLLVQKSDGILKSSGIIFKEPSTGIVYMSNCSMEEVFNNPANCRSTGRLLPKTKGIAVEKYIRIFLSLINEMPSHMPVTIVWKTIQNHESILSKLQNKYQELEETHDHIRMADERLTILIRTVRTLELSVNPLLADEIALYKELLAEEAARKNGLEAAKERLSAEITATEKENGDRETLLAKIAGLRSDLEKSIVNSLDPAFVSTDKDGQEFIANLELILVDSSLEFKIKRAFLDAADLRNAVQMNKCLFASIDDFNPLETTVSCQTEYLPLPQGWEIAPNDATSAGVISKYPWGTHVMVLANGDGIRTAIYGSSAGELWKSNQLLQSGALYKPANCSIRILIRTGC